MAASQLLLHLAGDWRPMGHRAVFGPDVVISKRVSLQFGDRSDPHFN